jgi:hypothetical protein
MVSVAAFQPDPLIYSAIEQKRLVRLQYHDKERILEPHDHGVINGAVQLLGYQIAGKSSRPLPNWIYIKTDEMINPEALNETFPGGRQTPSGNHTKWDQLFIRVEPASKQKRAGSA